MKYYAILVMIGLAATAVLTQATDQINWIDPVSGKLALAPILLAVTLIALIHSLLVAVPDILNRNGRILSRRALMVSLICALAAAYILP